MLAVSARAFLLCVCTFVAAQAAAPPAPAREDTKFYKQFDPTKDFVASEFNKPERLAVVRKIAERFPEYIHTHADQLFFLAAYNSNVSLCLWLADNGLDLQSEVNPMLPLFSRPELVPVIKRLMDLGISPDAEIKSGEFRGKLHEYAFMIRQFLPSKQWDA